MDYYEENKMFKKWLRKQNLNPLAELYARHLFFNVGGWEAVRRWQTAQHALALDAPQAAIESDKPGAAHQ